MKITLTFTADQALAFRKAMENVEWPSTPTHFARTLLAAAADCVAVAKDIPLPLAFDARQLTPEERSAWDAIRHATAQCQQ